MLELFWLSFVPFETASMGEILLSNSNVENQI